MAYAYYPLQKLSRLLSKVYWSLRTAVTLDLHERVGAESKAQDYYCDLSDDGSVRVSTQ